MLLDVYASATSAGSLVFQASSVARSFWRAVAPMNRGNGGQDSIGGVSLWKRT